MMTVLRIIVVLLFMAVTAHAATFHVKTTGSNSNTCTQAQTDTTPKATLGGTTGAAQCASPGDIIEIWAGTYTNAPAFWSSVQTLANGSAGNVITVQKHGSDVVWLAPTGGSNVINLVSTAYWTFDGINLNGRLLNSGSATPSTSISFGATSHHLTFKNATVLDTANNSGLGNGGQALFIQGDDHLIRSVTVQNTHLIGGATSGGDFKGSHCIYAGDSANRNIFELLTIKGCGGQPLTFNESSAGSPQSEDNILRQSLISDYHRDPDQNNLGVSLSARQTRACAYNNIIFAGPGTGIVIGGTTNIDSCLYNNTIITQSGDCIRVGQSPTVTGAKIKNNICYSNGGGIRLYAGSTNAVLDSNIIWNVTSGYPTPVVDAGVNTTNTNTIAANPLLVNSGSNPPNAHLSAGSPAINAGVDLYAATPPVTVDYAGTARTAHAGGDTLFEIGAYNFGTAAPPNHLDFLSPPVSGTLVGAELPDVVVEVLDAANARQTSDTGNCVASKATGTGTLGGTLTRAVSSGLCTFDNLTFDAADTDFSITITKSGGTAATAVTSLQFSVIAAPSGQGSPTLILRQY